MMISNSRQGRVPVDPAVSGGAIDAPKDRLIRDVEVPELARRMRGDRDSWVVYVRRDGCRPQKVTLGDCSSIPPALARELARELALGLGTAPVPSSQLSGSTTLSDFSTVFLKDCRTRWRPSTLRTHEHCLRVQVLPTLGHLQLREITRQNVVAWLHQMGASKGARNRALSVLSSLLGYAELRGFRAAESNPCKGLRRHEMNFRADYLDAAGYAALGRAFERVKDQHFVAVEALRFCALTGCRKAEVLHLTWAMIDGPRAALPESKTGPKSIWLGRPVLRLLAGLPRGGDVVFEHAGAPLTARELDRVWNVVRRDVGRPRLRLHDLRHSFASVAVSEGFDLLVVGGLLGHSDKGSTAGYAHLDTRVVAAASQRVGKHLAKVIAKQPKRLARKPNSAYVAFVRSKDNLPEFCAARGLDPDTFRKGLAAWRAENRRAAR